MADTPPAKEGETTTPVVQPENKGNNEEAAQLRKELEQARMRANQLENEKQARDKAEEDARRKQLEEKEEYKTLYEKTEAELKARRDKEESDARSKELASASETILKDYPKEVQELAATAGIGLSDDSEAGKAVLKDKLEQIKSKLPNTSQVESNNGYIPPAGSPEAKQLVTPDDTGATPMALASAKGDVRPALKYIGGLESINQLKKMSGYYK